MSEHNDTNLEMEELLLKMADDYLDILKEYIKNAYELQEKANIEHDHRLEAMLKKLEHTMHALEHQAHLQKEADKAFFERFDAALHHHGHVHHFVHEHFEIDHEIWHIKHWVHIQLERIENNKKANELNERQREQYHHAHQLLMSHH